ncbi:MAG: tyrosine-type recombinase/integrase, partial [Firmicutes bacterium]|nr:tyrosine-type recombinase/integrase [Bacillota bacterium]
YETSRDVAKRSVIVPHAVLDALKEHREQQEKNHIKTACYFVFTNSTGEALSKELLDERIFELAKRRAGLKNIKFDDLRYSYATALLDAGESLEFIKRQLGYPVVVEEIDGQEPIPPEDEWVVSKRLALDLGITPAHREAS